jgi:COMPASS component SWD3
MRLWKVFGAASSSSSSQTACCKTYVSPQHHVNTKYCIQSAFVTSNPNRQCIVTGSETGNILLFDINSKEVRQVLKGGHGADGDPILAVSSHDSQELLASGGMTQDKTVQFWAAESISQTWCPNRVEEAGNHEVEEVRGDFQPSAKRRASLVA